MIQKHPNRQQQVSDIAHPREVTQSSVAPIVNYLGQEKDEREETQQAKSGVHSLTHVASITRDISSLCRLSSGSLTVEPRMRSLPRFACVLILGLACAVISQSQDSSRKKGGSITGRVKATNHGAAAV